jgi:hypothetical protein
MQIQNTSDGSIHVNAPGFEDIIVPGRRGDKNGAAEASEAFIKAAKAVDIQSERFKDGTLLVGETPAPVAPPTVAEKAAAAVEDALKRQAVDNAAGEKAAKDKPKK